MATEPELPFSLLLASSVHDIKNSIGMLMDTLAVTVQESDADDHRQRQRFAVMQGEAARINNDLMYLLGLYRLQQRQLTVQIQEVFLQELLGDQLAQQQLLFDTRGITGELVCDPDLVGYCDPTLVAGILSNVLVNALRYSRRHIAVRAWAEADGVTIAVDDDGPGFPAAMLAPAAATAPLDFATGSTRLGLYFAQEVARLHRRGTTGGQIELTNRASGGGRFLLHLP